MFENIKDGDLITLKLASGEEVVSTLKSHGVDVVSIEKALVLMQGPQGLAFGTFFSTAKQDQPINIARDKIVSVAHINDKIAGEYQKVFSAIKTVDKPKIIV
jgi:hypothetical protein|tara:strand:- start:1268 stop:1573 length:306 start_codon:yes stop_codon:yes gene_type:complete